MTDKIEWGAGTPGPWAVAKRKSRRVVNLHGVSICNAILRNQGGPKHKASLKDEHEAEANASAIAEVPAMVRFIRQIADGYRNKAIGSVEREVGSIADAILFRIDGMKQNSEPKCFCGQTATTKYDGDDYCEPCARSSAQRDFEEDDMPGGF